jgi:hypothetical protein
MMKDDEASDLRGGWREGAGLLVLRAGLVWFMFLWAIHKVITPKQYQQLAKWIDGVDVSFAQIYGMAAVQLLVCALAIIGIFRYFSYSALLVMHFFTVTRRWERFFDPFAVNDKGFPVNRNPVIDLAVLGALIALVLLIKRDNWSLGGWLTLTRGWRWWH